MIAALLHPFRWLRIFFQVATGSEVTGLPEGYGLGGADPMTLDEEMDPDWDGDWNEEEIEVGD